ncbi:MAG: hypothetical protein ABI596_00290 [Pyrinomonadaceae bacterium]
MTQNSHTMRYEDPQFIVPLFAKQPGDPPPNGGLVPPADDEPEEGDPPPNGGTGDPPPNGGTGDPPPNGG